jgi:hypothetical protein
MRRVICGVLIGGMFWGCTQIPLRPLNYEERKLISIHKKVGVTIDVEERKEFNLFPEIEDFRCAQFHEIEGNALEITLETGGGTFISVIRDSLMVKMLDDYIGNYEIYGDSIALFEKKWSILDHDMLGLPIAEHEIPRYAIPESHAVACGLGMSCLGVLPSLVLAFSISGSSISLIDDSGDIKPSFYPILMASEAAFIFIGVQAGREIDRIRVVNAIKQGRSLIKVEEADGLRGR